jgi:hypothetical protein
MLLYLTASLLGGLITGLALAAGMIKPWRGLALLLLMSILYVAAGLVPPLEGRYFALVFALGAVLLIIFTQLEQYWRRRHSKAVLGGKQLLLGSFTAFILAGIFLGPLWGLAVGSGIGGLGVVYLQGYHSLSALGWGLLVILLQGLVLLLIALFINTRVLAFF